MLGLISPVKANLDKEIGRQYNEELIRLISGILEANKYKDRERICLLIPQAQANLENGWSYHRQAGFSYELLVKNREMNKNIYQRMCTE